ncbi:MULTISPECIES: GspH/FimT family pseudopilin [unclassified Pseudomonas]|uniref:GspH/FimT family pseudopilin n=1 Tax=unclassified Pseudomonas TaxID=196821 RepID=UPI000BD5441C|nr:MULTISPECIES: GspH/FimT family pseudopilin [unclassified Pseudomonas]PVZ11313.1 type IV fimbrial biogenesis protein FimU [Pseudomonas sp. URIL14HWK12:I12]PVZ22311.1 type IV fimbrial biogenesis protein FimU [Pseudomonas sp. URIL14HWK12:I10]PVZ31565.1 type IV fimbrial biogenesis protein FimU [Pseudomonas sp. URIL14HWK12:I11]SNZ16562.1 type IV fimbrial biogenesis protein FimU [Pseudomonas sp. URIL14HWK12:I9]
MHQRLKGFTLVELIVTVAVLAIVAAIAVPSFITMMARGRADTETSDFYRALNYARLEAINRGVNVRVAPDNNSTGTWAGILNVFLASNANPPLRVVPAMASNSTMTASGAETLVEFNNLGSMISPSNALVFTYTNGTITRNIVVCSNGRMILNNGTTCP